MGKTGREGAVWRALQPRGAPAPAEPLTTGRAAPPQPPRAAARTARWWRAHFHETRGGATPPQPVGARSSPHETPALGDSSATSLHHRAGHIPATKVREGRARGPPPGSGLLGPELARRPCLPRPRLLSLDSCSPPRSSAGRLR